MVRHFSNFKLFNYEKEEFHRDPDPLHSGPRMGKATPTIINPYTTKIEPTTIRRSLR